MPNIRNTFLVAAAAVVLLAPLTTRAQGFVTCPELDKQPLIEMQEIRSDEKTHTLSAVMKVTDQDRTIWFNGPNDAEGNPTATFCASQHMRYFQGYRSGHPEEAWPETTNKEPLPGPTLRARVGDIVTMTFFNEINLTKFPNSKYWDRHDCDQVKGIYPKGGGAEDKNCAEYKGVDPKGGGRDDTFPNCFHGSSTANLHFHGTHTTPATTGDNVLIQIRPSLRAGPFPVATEKSVNLDGFFNQCRTNLATAPSSWPTKPGSLPADYWTLQETWITEYNKGVKDEYKLPSTKAAVAQGEWPEYYIGMVPYCFQLPKYEKKPADKSQLQMGQSPGTHWYHMHKHGATALNVANTLIGAFIIEGDYDKTLKDYYKTRGELKEKVLIIQQVGVTPNLERGGSQRSTAKLSVNGRRQPVIDMRPGEVQLWRIINGAPRSGVFFDAPNGIQWAQTAQDGVQLNPQNYNPPKDGVASQTFLMSAGNRVDLLLRVPADAKAGDTIPVKVFDVVKSTELPGRGTEPRKDPPVTLLTIRVSGAKGVDMGFIPVSEFPQQPEFLADIDPKTTVPRATGPLTFHSLPPNCGAVHTINGEKFSEANFSQTMTQNIPEEWTIINTTSDKAGPGPVMHPFHIHINPFQVVEVFDPWDPAYVFDKPTAGKCYINPKDPSTWKPCTLTELKKPFVWWDVFGIPGGREMPPDSRNVISGYFKMRSRFVDYSGPFVLHCHILAHEDRGMMQLIRVVPTLTNLHHH